MSEIFEVIAQGTPDDLKSLLCSDPSLASARNAEGVSALLLTLYHRKPEMTEILLAREPELNVFDAAALGRLEELEAILAANPEAAREFAGDGFTPLHIACFFSRKDATRVLLDAGADVAAVAQNPMLVQPLHSAASAVALGACKLLLEGGADPNARQHGGWTALHAAAMHGHVDLARLLLEHSADASQVADNGKNARALAREAGHDALLEFLGDE